MSVRTFSTTTVPSFSSSYSSSSSTSSSSSASSSSSSSGSTPKKDHHILVFRGDGIGPEIVDASLRILRAANAPLKITEMDFGHEAFQKTGAAITEKHLQAFDELRVIFKGPITIPPTKSNLYVELRGRKFTSANQVLRKIFSLYANVRPAKTTAGVKSRFDGVDLVVVRENTEDLYTGEERWVNDDTVEAIKRITRGASTRIAKFAFDYAVAHRRKLVTAVHKANVCKQSDGLFIACTKQVASQYPAIKYNEQLADSILTKLVQDPTQYDILLCPNLFGDLLSDLGAGLIGSLGLCGSGQFGADHAAFEPCHGSAPDIAGQGIANPISQLRSGVMMLQHLGEHEVAKRVDTAVDRALADGYLTVDLGGKTKTEDFVRATIERL